MRKRVLFLAAFTSIAMLVAALAVVRYSVPVAAAFFPVFAASMFLALLVWRGKHEFSVNDSASRKSRTALKWLSAPFVIGSISAFVMSLQEGWNIGDTIGAIFFSIFACLLAVELFRRKRATHSRRQTGEP